MTILENNIAVVLKRLWFEENYICIELSDGREVKVPLEFYPRLSNASSEELNNFEIIGLGTGIHWESLDEDLSVEGIVNGRSIQ